jgi:hypothetical protein
MEQYLLAQCYTSASLHSQMPVTGTTIGLITGGTTNIIIPPVSTITTMYRLIDHIMVCKWG